MDIEERYALVTRNSAELISEDELRAVLAEDRQPTAYIGFEPSGLVHMGWTLVAGKIRDLAEAGFKVTVFWADWHAYNVQGDGKCLHHFAERDFSGGAGGSCRAADSGA